MANRKVILSMSISLDGYVAAPNDAMDWMKFSREEWADLNEDLDNADTYLLGRKMFPEYSKHWQEMADNPPADADEASFGKRAVATQHIVFTKRDFKPDWNNTKVAHDPKTEIESLKKQPGKNIIVWGGAGFAASLLNLKLVDELRLVIMPTILTAGKTLYGNIKSQTELELINTKTVKHGVVIVRYKLK